MTDDDASEGAPGDREGMRVGDEELRTGSSTPEAVTEQPDLTFEHHPESKWIGDVLGLRLLAVGLTWAIRRRSSRTPAVPWVPLLATALVAAVAVVAFALVVSLLLDRA